MRKWNNNSTRALRRDGRREALQRLDEYLERTTTSSKAELIAQMRKAAFADVDELERSGEIAKRIAELLSTTGKGKFSP